MVYTTRTLPSGLMVQPPSSQPPGPVLILAWCEAEPGRTGEALLVPLEPAGASFVFGRQPAPGATEPLRLPLIRQRPGSNMPMGSPATPFLSRQQWVLQRRAAGSIFLRNVGRMPLKQNGRLVSECEVFPGDLLDLGGKLLFLCVERPALMTSLAGTYTFYGFGEADAFGLVGESEALWRLRQEIVTKGTRLQHVLVQGPSGSGKELVARALALAAGHGNYVSASAPDLSETLLEAELFGNMADFPQKGMAPRAGLIGRAHGSTLILDEIGEMKLELQSRLLRVMATGEYHRLGKAEPEHSRFRLVAATNRDDSAFRHDLLARFYDRLEVPDLNVRVEDIPLLAVHLLRGLGSESPDLLLRFFEPAVRDGRPRLSIRLVRDLLRHHYMTNVRELMTLLLEAIDASQGSVIEPPGSDTSRSRAFAPDSKAPSPSLSSSVALSEGGQRGSNTQPELVSGDALELLLDPELRQWLMILRQAYFSPTQAARLAVPHAARSSADVQLRTLIFVALAHSGWDTALAARELVGEDRPVVVSKLKERMEGTVRNLRLRLLELGREELCRALRREFGTRYQISALPALEAIEEGRL